MTSSFTSRDHVISRVRIDFSHSISIPHLDFCPFFVLPSQVNWTRLQVLALRIPEMVIFKTKYQANKRQQISLSLFLSDYFSLRLTTSNRKFQLFPPPPEKKTLIKFYDSEQKTTSILFYVFLRRRFSS